MLGQSHHRRIDLDRIQHRSEPEQGLRAGIDEDALDLQLWLGGRLQIFLSRRALWIRSFSYFFYSLIDHQFVQGDGHGPGRKLDLAHMDAAPQLLGGPFFQLAFGHPGHYRPQQQP